jgi:hypothetical protein
MFVNLNFRLKKTFALPLKSSQKCKYECIRNICIHSFEFGTLKKFRTTNENFFIAKLLDPARPTRKFSPQQIMEDPKEVLQRLKEEARHLMKVVEEDDIELEKAKQKRIEERRQREEQ